MDQYTGKTFRIDAEGNLSLPLIGVVPAGNCSTIELESRIKERLASILKQPEATVSILEYHSQPISILGAVNSPGVRQLEGHKRLVEVIAMAGGLRADAGNVIIISRDLKLGAIPLPGETKDPSGRFSLAAVDSKTIFRGSDPTLNVSIMPGDTISVSKAELVYAVGSVNKAGAFTLGQNESLTALQVLTLAEGLQRTAAASKAKILRPTAAGSSKRTEIAVNLKDILAGKTADIALLANDILFIPNSGAKVASMRVIDTAVNLAQGAVIYGRY